MAVSAAAIGAVVTTLISLYPILDSAIREKNQKKAAEIRREMNNLIDKNNLNVNKLRTQIEKRGVNFNQFKDNVYGVSRAGSAARLRDKREKEYYAQNQADNAAINKLTHQSDVIRTEMEAEASKKDAAGLTSKIKTIFGGE